MKLNCDNCKRKRRRKKSTGGKLNALKLNTLKLLSIILLLLGQASKQVARAAESNHLEPVIETDGTGSGRSAAADSGQETGSAGPASQTILLAALLVLINLIVILGNILVITAVYATVKLRSVTNIFIVSLATADLMLGVFVLPYALTMQILDVWIFGKIWCRGWLVTDVWISTASILNLCAISVDRYVAVTRPVKYRSIMTPRKAKTIVAGVWIVSFLICFPPLLQHLNEPAGRLTQQHHQQLSNQQPQARPGGEPEVAPNNSVERKWRARRSPGAQFNERPFIGSLAAPETVTRSPTTTEPAATRGRGRTGDLFRARAHNKSEAGPEHGAPLIRPAGFVARDNNDRKAASKMRPANGRSMLLSETQAEAEPEGEAEARPRPEVAPRAGSQSSWAGALEVPKAIRIRSPPEESETKSESGSASEMGPAGDASRARRVIQWAIREIDNNSNNQVDGRGAKDSPLDRFSSSASGGPGQTRQFRQVEQLVPRPAQDWQPAEQTNEMAGAGIVSGLVGRRWSARDAAILSRRWVPEKARFGPSAGAKLGSSGRARPAGAEYETHRHLIFHCHSGQSSPGEHRNGTSRPTTRRQPRPNSNSNQVESLRAPIRASREEMFAPRVNNNGDTFGQPDNEGPSLELASELLLLLLTREEAAGWRPGDPLGKSYICAGCFRIRRAGFRWRGAKTSRLRGKDKDVSGSQIDKKRDEKKENNNKPAAASQVAAGGTPRRLAKPFVAWRPLPAGGGGDGPPEAYANDRQVNLQIARATFVKPAAPSGAHVSRRQLDGGGPLMGNSASPQVSLSPQVSPEPGESGGLGEPGESGELGPAERKFLVKPQPGIDYETREPEVTGALPGGHFCLCSVFRARQPIMELKSGQNRPGCCLVVAAGRQRVCQLLAGSSSKWPPGLGKFCQQRGEIKGQLNDTAVAYELCLLPAAGDHCNGLKGALGADKSARVKRQTKAHAPAGQRYPPQPGLSWAPSGPEVARDAAANKPASVGELEQGAPISPSSSISSPQSGQPPAPKTTMDSERPEVAGENKEPALGCALFDDKPYVIYSALGSFYIPMLVMIFFYSRIYLVASRAHKAMQRGYMTTKWPVSGGAGGKGANSINSASNNNNNNNNASNNTSSMASQLAFDGGAAGSGQALAGNGPLPGGRQEPERVTLRIHRREKGGQTGGGHHSSSNGSQQTSPSLGNLSRQARQEERLAAAASKLVQLSLEEQQLQLQRARQSMEERAVFVKCLAPGTGSEPPGEAKQPVASGPARAIEMDPPEPEAEPPEEEPAGPRRAKHHRHKHHHHNHHHRHHEHQHQHHHKHRKHHKHQQREGGSEKVNKPECISGRARAYGNDSDDNNNNKPPSLNSIQITVSHYDERHSESKQANHQVVPMIDDDCELQANLEATAARDEPAGRCAPQPFSKTPRGSDSNGSPTSATTTTTAITTLIDAPAKSERSRSIDVRWPGGGGGGGQQPTSCSPPEVDSRTPANNNNNSSLASNFARTDRSNSCEPTPTIVVNWLPAEVAGAGSADSPANWNLSAGKDLGMIRSSPALSVGHDCEARRQQLRPMADGAKAQPEGAAGSQGSGLSMMASIPNQVRKQSMMLLSTLTTRSSQTLRRLSMVASHPVESLLNRTRSRDDDDEPSSYSPSADDDDDNARADREPSPAASRRRRRRRKKKQKRRKPARSATPGAGPAGKKTLDDYLMAVAGIDNSSDDDRSYDDDDDFTDEDDDEQVAARREEPASGGPASYALLFEPGAQAEPAALLPPSSAGAPRQEVAILIGEPDKESEVCARDLETPLLGESPVQLPAQPEMSSTKQTPKEAEDGQRIGNNQQMLRPSSGLQRKGAYYERATSRNGSNQLINVELINADLEAGSSRARSMLSSLVGKSIGNGQVRSTLVESGLAAGAPAPAGGGLAKGRAAGRRRGAKQTSRWHAKRLRAETKAAKTVAIIVGGFIFCWLPFFTAYLSRAIICDSPACIPQSLLSVFIWLGYLNSAINPVIYGLFSADFRHAFKNIVCRCRLRNTDDTIVVSVLVDSIIKSIL